MMVATSIHPRLLSTKWVNILSSTSYLMVGGRNVPFTHAHPSVVHKMDQHLQFQVI